MPDETLLMLAREVRSKTLKLLDGMTDEEARFAAPGLNNTIVWHAAHAYVVVESICFSKDTGRQPKLPEGWFEKFGWTSRPTSAMQWPPLAEVVAQLKGQAGRVSELISGHSEEQLARKGSYWPTVRYAILHAIHDEANHQGEIWLLRKMYAGATTR